MQGSLVRRNMITSKAPTRIDLAGGTLDIWPLYLLLDNPPTVNVAIDLYATVEIRPRRDRAVIVESKDLGICEKFRSIDHLPRNHPLDLILRTLRFYRPGKGLELTTDCQAPAGSGIGGSSALGIALNGALNRLTSGRFDKFHLLEIAKNIETQVISVPTGWQDYFPALYGGALAVQPDMVRVGAEPLSVDLDQLTRRFVLCYTGKPRQSGINNWQVMKQMLDGNRSVHGKLSRIAAVARDMRQALLRGNVEEIARRFDEEWKARKALAPAISTPEMDRLIAAARKRGALAAKVCGAGGGGCVAFIVRAGARERVAAELKKLGGKILDFKFVKHGLRVRES